MVAAAERSVIITLKLQPDAQNQAIAALTSSQAQSVVTTGNKAYEELVSISEHSMKQITVIQQSQAILRTNIDNQEQNKHINLGIQTLTKQTWIEKEQTRSVKVEVQKREKFRQKETEKQEKEAKELAKKIQEAEKTRVESHQQAYDAAMVAVQGLADISEGALKMGLISEENFEKFAQKLDMLQEGIRIFKGFSDVIWKGREALIALSTATKAQAAANKLMSVSNVTTAATTAAAGASSAGSTAMSAAGGAVATGGGATAAGGGSVIAGTVVLAKLAALMAALAAAGLALHDGLKWLLSWVIDFGEGSGTASQAVWSLWEAQEQNTKSQEKLTKAEETRQRILDARTRFEEQEAKKAELASDLQAASKEVAESKRVSPGSNKQAEYALQRASALNEVRTAEQAILDDRKVQKERIAGGHFQSLNNRERVMKGLEESQHQLLKLEKDRLKIIADQKQQIKEQLKAEIEKRQVAEDALNSEKQRLLEKYGRLTEPQRYRIQEISNRYKAGDQLSRQDIKDLNDTGLSGTIGANYYANIGARAGGTAVLNNLGLLNQQKVDVQKAKEEEQKKQRELARLTAIEDQVRARYQAEAERRQRIVNERVGINIDQNNLDPEEVPGFQLNQDPIINEIQNASAEMSDNTTQRSMEVVKALGQNLEAMNEGLEDMKQEIEKNRFKKKAYG